MMKTSLLGVALLAATISAPLGAQAQGKGGQPPNAPFAGAARMTTEQALKQAPKMDPGLAPLDKAYNAAAAKLKKSPKDAKAKKAFVEAAYKYGHEVMTDKDNKLTPPVKYRAALALYRKALAVDPKHKPSLEDKKMIEDVYASMGMPIPK